MSVEEVLFTTWILTSCSLLFSSFFSLLQMLGFWSAKEKTGRLHVAVSHGDVGADLPETPAELSLAGPQSLDVLHFVLV